MFKMKEDEEVYKLYGFIDNERYGRTYGKLKQTNNEYEIIKAIDQDIKTTELMHYLIVERINDTDYMNRTINCYEDFIDYIEDYRRRKGPTLKR